MGWETRDRGGRYYTRSRREGGRVIREYVGCGRVGELAAAADAAARVERETDHAAIRAERERVQAVDARLANLHRMVDLLTRGHLLATGFERYKRQWRKRRDDTSNQSAGQA